MSSDLSHIDNAAFETVLQPSLESSDEEGPVLKRQRRPQSKKGYEERLMKLTGHRNRLQDHIRDLRVQMLERFPEEEEEEEEDGENGDENEGEANAARPA